MFRLFFNHLFLTFILLIVSTGQLYAENLDRIIRVDDPDLPENMRLQANAPSSAEANTRHIARLMESAPESAAIIFPAGDWYFDGSARPAHGTIETSRPGQTISGQGAGITRLIQTNAEKDFGFSSHPDKKRVAAATVRIRHKGCSLRDMSIILDSSLPLNTIAGSAAIQIAHIKHLPDGQPMIIETTGQGIDYLLDHVDISRVNVGENTGGGIQASHFFELGIEILGSGGHVRIRQMDRLDAYVGIRLDNGNHCGQGEYNFEDIHMIGRHGVTDGGVFFDWVGGQAPLIRRCSASFINGFHAGPLGVHGDRFEPYPEGEVHRSHDRDWDWLTWHGHPVVENPNRSQLAEWYGLPRFATITRIGSKPRTGGMEWIAGKDFRQEQVEEEGDLEGTSRIHWLSARRPDPGTIYYVTFQQPKEYRVHDLQWGILDDFSSQEAGQQNIENPFAIRLDDQGFGTANADFHFAVGFGFTVSRNFILNGDIFIRGDVGYMQWSDNSLGVCTVNIQGLGEGRHCHDLRFSQSKHNRFNIGDYVDFLTIDNNTIWESVILEAPNHARHVAITGNTIRNFPDHGISLQGPGLQSFRIQDNHIGPAYGDGIVIRDATGGLVTGNIMDVREGTPVRLEDTREIVTGNNLPE